MSYFWRGCRRNLTLIPQRVTAGLTCCNTIGARSWCLLAEMSCRSAPVKRGWDRMGVTTYRSHHALSSTFKSPNFNESRWQSSAPWSRAAWERIGVDERSVLSQALLGLNACWLMFCSSQVPRQHLCGSRVPLPWQPRRQDDCALGRGSWSVPDVYWPHVGEGGITKPCSCEQPLF